MPDDHPIYHRGTFGNTPLEHSTPDDKCFRAQNVVTEGVVCTAMYVQSTLYERVRGVNNVYFYQVIHRFMKLALP